MLLIENEIIVQRFAYRQVLFDIDMIRSFYRLPKKEITTVVKMLLNENLLLEFDNKYILKDDFDVLKHYRFKPVRSIYAMHRNDFLVKSNEYWLKKKYKHSKYDTLQYLLIDGEFRGACVGHFRNGPYDLEDVIVDLPQADAVARKSEILESIYKANYGDSNRIKRYCGEVL